MQQQRQTRGRDRETEIGKLGGAGSLPVGCQPKATVDTEEAEPVDRRLTPLLDLTI